MSPLPHDRPPKPASEVLRRPGWLAALAALCATPTLACGPFFPNQVIVRGDAGVLALPPGDLAAELESLRPPGPPPFRSVEPDGHQSVYRQSAAADVAELTAALAALPVERRIDVVAAYDTLRDQLTGHFEATAAAGKPVAPPHYAAVPADLPPEFADYVRGLLAFDAGDATAARATWAALLARPADQRQRRSTWAAFMVGRSLLKTDPAAAAPWFVRTRDLANQGFADSLGLAASSYGWQAQAELDGGHQVAAIRLYVQQLWTGDLSAQMSLREAARATVAAGPAALAAAAADPVAARVIAAYVLADGGPYRHLDPADVKLVPGWLAAVKAAGVVDAPAADRFAWAAYRAGDYPAAADWAARAPADSLVAQWVRAKLLLRGGRVEAATAVLAAVVRGFPTDPNASGPPLSDGDDAEAASHAGRRVADDLALLRLTRGQYADALSLLLRTHHWNDAAYVAERVLTADELRTFADAHPDGDLAGPLRHLLARRLVRLGRWRDARPYFDAAWQAKLDAYIAGIRDGHDASKPAADRAAAFLTAAHLAYADGLGLLATELEPDFANSGGLYDDKADGPRGQADRLTRPSADEVARWEASTPADLRRWHYKYVAADHAWSAAALMPDNADATAAVLAEAGGWLKARDPKAADRFYKALVRRCPATGLGKRAAAAHWFPK